MSPKPRIGFLKCVKFRKKLLDAHRRSDVERDMMASASFLSDQSTYSKEDAVNVWG